MKSLNCFFCLVLVHFWKYRGGFNSVMKAKQYVRENKVGKFNILLFIPFSWYGEGCEKN